MRTVKLGQSDLDITPLGLGCWQFSRDGGIAPKFWRNVDDAEARDIVQAALDGGVNWFDTAEIYGSGTSEQVLAGALSGCGQNNGDVVVATKWNPVARRASTIGETIDERLDNLAPFAIDLHQVHNPASLSSVDRQMEEMARLVELGKIKHVGVSNFSARAMERAHRALEKHGLQLTSNQVMFHLLRRNIETNGVLDVARDIGATIIAYSPLAQGVLTGRFHKDPDAVKKTRLARRLSLRFQGLARSASLVRELEAVAEEVGATAAQVALNWTVSFHGDTVVAIPGASRASQAQSNAAALSFELTPEQRERIDRASREVASGVKKAA